MQAHHLVLHLNRLKILRQELDTRGGASKPKAKVERRSCTAMSKTSHHIPEKTTNVMKSESTKQDTDWLFLGTAGTDGRRQLEILETGLNKTIIILKQPLANTQDPVKKIVYHHFTYT